jgi:hypothetical protein
VTLFTQRNEEHSIIKTLIMTRGAKDQSQRVRVMLSGESPHKNRRIGSSGSNLACKGLQLGMQAACHRDSNTEAHSCTWIQMNLHFMLMTATHLHLFRRIKSATRWCLGVDQVEDYWCRREITSNIVCASEASRWRWTVAKIIGAPEVLVLDDVERWANVASSFMGHGNICKSQRVVMIL